MNDATSPAGPAGEYVVVARRYRPQSFESLIGQEHVARALTGAIETGRVGHAYLFTGARGVGKTSAARILAKALDCVKGPTAHPCNECEICTSIAAGSDVDVIEIDGASNRGIDEIRQLRQNAGVRPSRARFKIYIIDEVHMLTKEAFNALLKTLEEPPEHVKFIFATTEPNKIPITILSRCQRYDFAGIESGAIHRRLAEIAAAEGIEAEPEALQIIAMRAAGSMRDSQSLLEQLLATGQAKVTSADVTSLLGLAPASRLSAVVQPLVERNAGAALAEFDAAIAEGAEPGQLVDQLLGYFRDALTQSVGGGEELLLHALPSQREELRSVARQMGVQTLLAILQIFDHAASRMRITTQVRTLSEMALVRVCQLENLDELATLIEQLKTGAAPGSTSSLPVGAKKNLAPDPPRSVEPQPRALPGGSSINPVTSNGAAAVSPPPRDPPAEPGAESLAAANVSQKPIDAERLWKQTLESLSGMTYEHAAAAERVEMSPEGRLIVSFPDTSAGKFCRDNCQRPGNLSRIEAALAEHAGRPLAMTLALHAAAQTPDQATRRPVATAKEQHAALLASPFVQKAADLFAADASRIKYVAAEGT